MRSSSPDSGEAEPSIPVKAVSVRRKTAARLACAVLAGASILGLAERARAAPAPETRSKAAPDGALRAVVTAIGGESSVEIWKGPRLLLRRSYASADGQHGFIVEHSGWTADSQFFVFSLANSGGHQAWHYPAFAYSRRTQRLSALDDRIGDLADPNFQLSPPDVLDAKVTKGGGPAVEVRVSLGRSPPPEASGPLLALRGSPRR